MESKWMAMLLLVLGFLLLGGGEWCEGCLDEERLAISRLKPFFPFLDYAVIVGGPGSGSDDYSEQEDDSSVEKEESSLDCCKWESVECNPTTGRVTHLFLNLTAMNWYDLVKDEYQTNTNQRKFWYLNASLFLPFEELQYLSLSGNLIAGCVADQGFEKLSSKLNNLEILDLSFTYFNDSILTSISELSSLKSLNLERNQFTTDGIKVLSKLNNLEILNLSDNNLSNNILSQLRNFTSLKSLNLEDCGLEESVDLLEFNTLVNLKELYLGGNEIKSLGSSFQELELVNLNVLDLSDNPLDNSILSSLGRLLNLKTLSFGGFQLKGSINITEIDGLSNLEELDISCYSDNGCNITLQSLGLLSSLKTLSLYEFNFDETELYSHSQNKRQNLTNLEELDLWYSSLPSEFIGTLPSLKKLHMYYCYSDDNLFTQIFQLKHLETLRIYGTSPGNNFLPTIGALPSLRILNLRSQALGSLGH